MAKKNKTSKPAEIPSPEKLPEITPVKEPEDSGVTEEDPDSIPDEDPFETPPAEEPPPGEGP